MVLTGAGISVRLTTAFAMARLFASLLYGVMASEPLAFAVITQW